MIDRVVGLRGGEDARERRRLKECEIAPPHAEVGLRGGFDPIRAVAEVHGIEVLRQDLVLRERALHLDGEEDLADLLFHGPRGDDVIADAVLSFDVVPRVDALHELLGDGRAALDLVAGDQVAPGGPDGALDIDAGVVVEARVLDGDHRVAEMFRHLSERDQRPVDRAVERGQEHIVAVVDERRLDRGERFRQIDPDVREGQDPDAEQCERDGRECEGPPVAAEEPPRCRGGPSTASSFISRTGRRGRSSWYGQSGVRPTQPSQTRRPSSGRDGACSPSRGVSSRPRRAESYPGGWTRKRNDQPAAARVRAVNASRRWFQAQDRQTSTT